MAHEEIYLIHVIHQLEGNPVAETRQIWYLNSTRFKAQNTLFGCLFGSYDISTLVSYLMPNLVLTYILNIWDLWTFCWKDFYTSQNSIFAHTVKRFQGFPRGVMVKTMDCGIVVSEFELQSRHYVYFRTNTLGKDMNPPYPPSYGVNSTTTVLLGEWLWH